MRAPPRSIRLILGLALLGTTLGLPPAGLESAQAATCLPPSSSPVVSGSFQTFHDISVLSPCSAWAVGENGGPLIEYWDGTTWTHQTSASPGPNAWLSSVVAISPTNAWAVGTYVPSSYAGWVEHWNGVSWQLVSTPTLLNASFFEDVTAASAGKVWLVGSVSNGSAFVNLIEHWNGSSWSIDTNPRPGTTSFFRDVDTVSSKNVWAVGSYSDNGSLYHTLIEHWNGSKWSKVTSPNGLGSSFSNFLEGVSMHSATDGWAVGNYDNINGKQQTLTEHWNGSGWKIVKAPDPGGDLQQNSLMDVADLSASNAWAVGSYSNGSDTKPLVLKWNGRAWKQHADQTPTPGDPGEAEAVDASVKTDVWWGGSLNLYSTVWVTHCC